VSIQTPPCTVDGDLPAQPRIGRAHRPRRQALPTRVWTRGVVTLAAAALFAALPAAGASAALIDTSLCDGAALSQPFAHWGDNNNYKLMPGGDFEGSLSGYTFTGGAKRVSGSESFAATGDLGGSSVSIPAGGSVLTPATCVNAANPSYRFFYKSSGGLLGLLPAMTVSLVYRDSVLGLVELPLGTALPSGKWAPSPTELTLSALPAALANGDVPLALRFTAVAGTWTIDDVFVDPYCRW
jgi:hypothetical protein